MRQSLVIFLFILSFSSFNAQLHNFNGNYSRFSLTFKDNNVFLYEYPFQDMKLTFEDLKSDYFIFLNQIIYSSVKIKDSIITINNIQYEGEVYQTNTSNLGIIEYFYNSKLPENTISFSKEVLQKLTEKKAISKKTIAYSPYDIYIGPMYDNTLRYFSTYDYCSINECKLKQIAFSDINNFRKNKDVKYYDFSDLKVEFGGLEFAKEVLIPENKFDEILGLFKSNSYDCNDINKNNQSFTCRQTSNSTAFFIFNIIGLHINGITLLKSKTQNIVFGMSSISELNIIADYEKNQYYILSFYLYERDDFPNPEKEKERALNNILPILSSSTLFFLFGGLLIP